MVLILAFGAFLIFFLLPVRFPFQIILVQSVFSRLFLPHFLSFFGCRLFLRHSRWYVFHDKVKINLGIEQENGQFLCIIENREKTKKLSHLMLTFSGCWGSANRVYTPCIFCYNQLVTTDEQI